MCVEVSCAAIVCFQLFIFSSISVMFVFDDFFFHRVDVEVFGFFGFLFDMLVEVSHAFSYSLLFKLP